MPLLALSILLPLVANAQSRTDCNVINSRILKQAVHYCVQLPPDYDAKESAQRRYPVLYFLHGLGQNEQTLFSTGGWSVIEDLRRQHKIADFLVAAPEGKRSFYINSPGNKLRYSDFFLQEFMPYIEGKYRVRPGRRVGPSPAFPWEGTGRCVLLLPTPNCFPPSARRALP